MVPWVTVNNCVTILWKPNYIISMLHPPLCNPGCQRPSKDWDAKEAILCVKKDAFPIVEIDKLSIWKLLFCAAPFYLSFTGPPRMVQMIWLEKWVSTSFLIGPCAWQKTTTLLDMCVLGMCAFYTCRVLKQRWSLLTLLKEYISLFRLPGLCMGFFCSLDAESLLLWSIFSLWTQPATHPLNVQYLTLI